MRSSRFASTSSLALALVSFACGGESGRHPVLDRRTPPASAGSASTTGGTAGSGATTDGVNGGATDGPPCVNPACPTLPPADGDACSGCDWPPFGCGWDQRSVDGLSYTALCNDGQWLVFAEEDPPLTCCSTDADCALPACSDRCIEPVCVNGSCKIAYQRECWRDDQCAPDQACSGAVTCASHCTDPSACNEYDEPGVCVPNGQGCCLAESDCTGGAHCVQGVCKLASNGCYTGDDCGSAAQCLDVSVCPCGSACPEPDSQGHCEYMR